MKGKAKNCKFWEFRNQTEENAELLLYGDISDTSWWGDEVTPKQFTDDLKALGDVKEITVRINSGGGDVFAATAIGNALEQHKATVTAKIDGLCASAATIVACHCSKVIAANDSTYMIHPVKMGICAFVDAVRLRECLEALDTIRDNIVTLYAKKTGRDKEEVAEQMDKTSWFTAAQAKENGFIDELIDENGESVIENRGGLLFVNSIGTEIPFNDTPKFVQDNLAANSAADCNVNTPKVPAGTTPANNQKEVGNMEIRTVNDLRDAYPELVGAIEAAAAETAAAAERQRIHDIEDMCMPGNEAFANEAKFEKPISASDFAMAAVKNAKQAADEARKTEDEKKKDYLDGLKDDAAGSGLNGVNNEPEGTTPDAFLDAIKSVNGKK